MEGVSDLIFVEDVRRYRIIATVLGEKDSAHCLTFEPRSVLRKGAFSSMVGSSCEEFSFSMRDDE
jgi:hypothetical protein